MKKLLAVLMLMATLGAYGQPVQRNWATTNSNPVVSQANGGTGVTNVSQLNLPQLLMLNVFLGDSRSFSNSVTGTNTWPRYFQTNLQNSPWLNAASSFTNFAQAGQTAFWVSTNIAATVGSLTLLPGQKGIAWVDCGVNDIGAGSNATQVETNLNVTYVAVRGYGFKVGAVTIAQNASWNSTQLTTLSNVNFWITNNPQLYDILVPEANQLGPQFQGDGLHENATGAWNMANLAMQGLLGNGYVPGLNYSNTWTGTNLFTNYSYFQGPLIIQSNAEVYLPGSTGDASCDVSLGYRGSLSASIYNFHNNLELTTGVSGATLQIFDHNNYVWLQMTDGSGMTVNATTGNVDTLTVTNKTTTGAFSTGVHYTTVNYIATNTFDHTIIANSSLTTLILLPTNSPSLAGRMWTVKQMSAVGSVIVTNSNGSDHIDGSLNYTLGSQYKYVDIQSDGTNYWVIGNN